MPSDQIVLAAALIALFVLEAVLACVVVHYSTKPMEAPSGRPRLEPE